MRTENVIINVISFDVEERRNFPYTILKQQRATSYTHTIGNSSTVQQFNIHDRMRIEWNWKFFHFSLACFPCFSFCVVVVVFFLSVFLFVFLSMKICLGTIFFHHWRLKLFKWERVFEFYMGSIRKIFQVIFHQ